MTQKIKIKLVIGDNQGNELKKLYFQENVTVAGNQYNLYDSSNHDELIHTHPLNLTNGTDFSFDYDDLHWEITDFTIAETATIGIAGGNWMAKSKSERGDDDATGDESGTFQAQSGTTRTGELNVYGASA